MANNGKHTHKQENAKVQEQQSGIMFEVGDESDFYEGMDQGAHALPFICVLQALSPQCQRGNPAFIAGAQPGQLYNTVTKELFDAVDVTVVRRTHTFCSWKRREDGGGFRGEWEATPEAQVAFAQLPVDEKNRRINKEGLEVTEHRNFYCVLVRNNTGHEPAILSMTKTQLKVAREWNSLISMKSARAGANNEPRMTSEIWRLGTTLRQKDGNSWFVFTVAHAARHTDLAVYGEVRAAIPAAKEIKLLGAPPAVQEDAAPQDLNNEIDA